MSISPLKLLEVFHFWTWTKYEWETFFIVFVLFWILLPGWMLMQAVWSAKLYEYTHNNPFKQLRMVFVTAHPDDESM